MKKYYLPPRLEFSKVEDVVTSSGDWDLEEVPFSFGLPVSDSNTDGSDTV